MQERACWCMNRPLPVATVCISAGMTALKPDADYSGRIGLHRHVVRIFRRHGVVRGGLLDAIAHLANAAMIAAGLAGAVLTRVFIVFWIPVLCCSCSLRPPSAGGFYCRILHFAMIGAVVLLSLAPIVARNVSQYGAWALTPQGGSHLALWIVPWSRKVRRHAVGGRHQGHRDTVSREVSEHRQQSVGGVGALRTIGARASVGARYSSHHQGLARWRGDQPWHPAIIGRASVSDLPRTGFLRHPGASTL